MKVVRLTLAAALSLASLTPCWADPAPVVHYAPAENLEHIDVALIDRAEHEIDMAAYVLTDWPVIQALTRAADRVRIYLDGIHAPAFTIALLDTNTLWMLAKPHTKYARLQRILPQIPPDQRSVVEAYKAAILRLNNTINHTSTVKDMGEFYSDADNLLVQRNRLNDVLRALI